MPRSTPSAGELDGAFGQQTCNPVLLIKIDHFAPTLTPQRFSATNQSVHADGQPPSTDFSTAATRCSALGNHLFTQPANFKGDYMKAKITEQCMGDRNCNKLCPEVFEYDEDQLLSIVKFDVIPEKYEAVVLQAAQECGADAIIIEE
jgi:ferredoxin